MLKKMYSKILDENFEHNKKDNSVMFEDGTHYDCEEIKLLSKKPAMIKAVHILKKTFNAKVIK